uniref:Stromal cell-derived factor 2 n=1 Tax=Scophthalmus maximus TaxID=52904 RepID=A0A8D2ZFB7_SCOMX
MGELHCGFLPRHLPSLLLFVSAVFGPSLGTELSFVTCGSVVKLLNLKHNVRLHSHDVRYGSGSGQQSVTGVTAVEDSNSYWSVRGTSDAFCFRGTPVKCGQTIRLTHVNTGRNLHSHYFTSPLSSNQEVSAFGEEGEGDHLDEWTVQCGGSVWKREEAVQGGSRHVRPQPAQPVEGHGGRLHEAQREPGRQPRPQSPTHRVLIFTSLLLSLLIFLPVY